MGKSKHKLELMRVGRNQSQTPTFSIQASNFDDTGVLQEKLNMYLAQESDKLKEEPVGAGAAMDLAAAPCQQSEAADKWQCIWAAAAPGAPA